VLLISLLDRHVTDLRKHLFANASKEHAAYVLFGRAWIGETTWGVHSAHLLVSHSVEQVLPEAVLRSSPSEISWSTNDVVQKLKLADGRGLALGIVHNHCFGNGKFSRIDDQNESDLTRTLQNRNGSNCHLASLLLTPDGELRGRLWLSPSSFVDAAEIRTIGGHFKYEFVTDESLSLAAFLDRQVLALGPAFAQKLKRLRVVVAGCGGTGSAVAMLLARLGVGSIALIDDDIVEETNLNRLHGATLSDVAARRPKVEVVGRSISALGLNTQVVSHKGWLSDAICRDTLKSAHLVFGCTDDHAGRIFLNRLAYAYQIPVIDMGLAIQLTNSNPPAVQAMDGRVTVLIPGEACLLCRGVIDPRRASEEALRRQNPAEYERRKLEAYVLGEQEPSPAVITFTTELACMAVNEMIQRIQGYRGAGGETANRVRLFHRMIDLRPAGTSDAECRVCGQQINWSRGDTEPFLGIVS